MKSSLLDLNKPHFTNRLLVLALLISLLLTIWALGAYLWDAYRVVNDTQNFYWMARAQDPTLFPRDYVYIAGNAILKLDIFGFHLLLHRRSPGYGLLFYLPGTLIDYVWLTKLAGLTLMTICIIYLFKLGQFLQNNLTGLSLSLIFIFFNLASPLSLSVFSGLQRGFAVPIFIVFLYYLIRRQYIWAALLIVIGALIYLPNLPPMVLAYGLSLVDFKRPFKVSVTLNKSNLLPLIGALLLSSMVVVLALASQLGLLSPSPPIFPVQAKPALRISENPVYQSGGPMPLFTGFPFLGRAGIFNTGGDVTNFLVMLIFGFLIYRTVGRQSFRRVPKEVWYLVLAGVVMFFASSFFVFSLSSFALYLPSRYTRSTLFLTALFFMGLNWIDFLNKLPGWLRKNRHRLIFAMVSFSLAMGIVYLFSSNRPLLIPTIWLLGVMASGVLVLLGGSSVFWIAGGYSPLKGAIRWTSVLVIGGLTLYLGTIYTGILGIKTTNPAQPERDVYEFVASLPKDVMLAGDPDVMTNIPLFSKRSVLFRGLFPRGNAPIVEYFDAQYAETPDTMIDFCQRYQIDYLVLNTDKFTPRHLNREDFFYQPWNDQIVASVAGRSDFTLLRVEPTFISEPFRVIKCDAETILAEN